jgi:hypothetical protein
MALEIRLSKKLVVAWFSCYFPSHEAVTDDRPLIEGTKDVPLEGHSSRNCNRSRHPHRVLNGR